jgi:DNA uptake protein ComE-like DNA-binding protein
MKLKKVLSLVLVLSLILLFVSCSAERVNINTASEKKLQQIVHIGPVRAKEIIRLRPFNSVGELRKVNGISTKRLKDIKDQGLAYVDD